MNVLETKKATRATTLIANFTPSNTRDIQATQQKLKYLLVTSIIYLLEKAIHFFVVDNIFFKKIACVSPVLIINGDNQHDLQSSI
jgi:hypothetical protein